jgi:hypothetical protein
LDEGGGGTLFDQVAVAKEAVVAWGLGLAASGECRGLRDRVKGLYRGSVARFGFCGGVRLWRRRLYREPECTDGEMEGRL